MTPIEQWRTMVLSGLSLLNTLEQNLDDKELAVCLDGWIAWSQANEPEGTLQDTDQELARLMNAYTANCIKAKGHQLTAQRWLIEVFKERDRHR